MVLRGNRMESTPEGAYARQEARDRRKFPLDVITNRYWDQAEKMLGGKDSMAVREEVARFAEKVVSAREGIEQDERVDGLFNALKLRKVEVSIDTETKRERTAFAIALSRAYLRSVH